MIDSHQFNEIIKLMVIYQHMHHKLYNKFYIIILFADLDMLNLYLIINKN